MRPLCALLAALAAGCDAATDPADAVEVSGRGATFVEPVMKFWTAEYRERTGGRVTVSYTGSGSGNGVSSVLDRLADFGCTDVPLNRRQLAAAERVGVDVIHIPLAVGAVVPAYNLPGVDRPVVFSGPLLADIFRGAVRNWNDPALAALNPGVALPDLLIQPVARAEPSGTSFVFSDYLAKASQTFRAEVGASNEPKWPETVGVRQPRSDGVAGHVRRNPGAIGYVELTFALDTRAQFGAVVNRAGRAVLATPEAMTAAAEASLGVPQTAEPYSLHELTLSLTDAPGEASYPIAGVCFAVLSARQPGPVGRGVVEFLTWAAGDDAQALAAARFYAPLPAALREKARAKLATLAGE